MKKIPKREYTAEFEQQVVRQAQAVGLLVTAWELGLIEQTLRNWVKASAAGKLTAAGSNIGSANPASGWQASTELPETCQKFSSRRLRMPVAPS